MTRSDAGMEGHLLGMSLHKPCAWTTAWPGWVWGTVAAGCKCGRGRGAQPVPAPMNTAKLEHLASRNLLAILDHIICILLGFPAALSEEVS